MQFTSHAWINELKKHKIQISMDGKGRWADNIWIERFWRTIKYCGISMDGVETVKELRNSVKRFIGYYNEKRLHSSHDYQTPMKVYLESVTENSGTMFQYIYQRDVEQLVA